MAKSKSKYSNIDKVVQAQVLHALADYWQTLEDTFAGVLEDSEVEQSQAWINATRNIADVVLGGRDILHLTKD